MNQNAKQLMEEALALKRSGELDAARETYLMAITHDLAEPTLYYGLAKTNYLLSCREEAIGNYLRAAHLSYNHIKEIIDGKGLEREIIRERIESIPPDLLAVLREISAYAPLIMLDDNIPCNLGHALTDLTASPPQATLPHLEFYRRSIQGEEDLDEGSRQSLRQLEDELYLPCGREHLAENILWEMLGDKEVFKFY